MATLEQKKVDQRERSILRIMSTCTNFTGIQHDKCKADINYHEQFGSGEGCFANIPCTYAPDEQPKDCPKVQYPTRAEAETEKKESDELFKKSMQAMAAAHADAKEKGFGKDNGGTGEFKCPLCEDGLIRYSVASYNGHMHAGCTKGCVSWME